jgi:lipopolysaccharide transport system permease protein
VVFGRLAAMPSDGAPYPVFALAALVRGRTSRPAVTAASNSLTASTGLITKVYFPRLVIPFAAIAAGLPDLAIGLAFLGVVMAAYGVAPALAAVVVLPVLVASMLVTMAGVGCWLAALNIQFRDVKFVVPVLTQVWLYASPVIYPASMVPPRFRGLYALNPMAGVIEGFRAALLGSRPVPWGDVAVSTAVGAALFVSGTLYFRRTERVFADVA